MDQKYEPQANTVLTYIESCVGQQCILIVGYYTLITSAGKNN